MCTNKEGKKVTASWLNAKIIYHGHVYGSLGNQSIGITSLFHHDNELVVVDMNKSARKKLRHTNITKLSVLADDDTPSLPVSKKKVQKLIDLCHGNIFPGIYHRFYEELNLKDSGSETDEEDTELLE